MLVFIFCIPVFGQVLLSCDNKYPLKVGTLMRRTFIQQKIDFRLLSDRLIENSGCLGVSSDVCNITTNGLVCVNGLNVL